MKNTITYRILIAGSIILLFVFILTYTPQIFTNGTLSFENLNSVFGIIIVTTLFLTHNMLKNKDFKFENIYRVLFRCLILISVIFCGIMFYSLIENGFLSGKNLFWQLTGIVFGIISVIFLQYSQQKVFNMNKE